MGDGPVPAKIMIVGEAPGFREDDVRKPFAGKAGVLLDESLAKVGLHREDIFITNANKCHPEDNRTPSRTETKACLHYLESEIERVQPSYILTVGNTALYALTKKSGIMKHRGTPVLRSPIVFPTIHPAMVLRNPHYQPVWMADLAAFARLTRGEDQAVKSPKTYLVRSRKSLSVMCKMILESEAVAYDLETSGFLEYADDPQISTISVSVKPGLAFVVPIHHPDAPWKNPSKVLDAVGAALLYTNATRIAHNAKFDDRWLNQFGVPVHADFDTMIAAHLLEENRMKGLKPLAEVLLGVDAWADLDLSNRGAMTAALPKLARYNAKDTDYTLRLYYIFNKELQAEGNERTLRLFHKLMMPASKALTDIERTGLWVDEDRLRDRRVQIRKELARIDAKLTKLYGQQANWNSTRVIADLLFEKLNLPVIETTAKGAKSTKESVLLRLAHESEAAQLIIDYRKWAKYLSTYIDRWEEMRDDDGRIHPNYKLTGTVTGRLSSGKEEGSRGPGLNVQQVPRDQLIRSILGAPAGWRLVEADFGQIELRIAAHYSGDPTLLRIFQLGQDPHMTMAMKMTGRPADKVTKEQRKKAKGVNFGFLFGMGAEHYVTYAFDSYGLDVTLEDAQDARDTFFRTYRMLRPWHDRQRRLVRNYKRVNSLIGRVRHLPDVDSHDKKVQGEAERQAINSPVQSLASDMMLLAMIILHKKMNPAEARIVGTIHDALLFEIREDVEDVWIKQIRQTMEHLPLKARFGVTLDVPIIVDIKSGQHWGEGTEVPA